MSTRDSQRNSWLRDALGATPDSVTPASSDASFRRYFRVIHGGQSRIVMDAPPPQEDCRPFVQVTDLLHGAALTVPQVFSADLERGFLLLSDLGDAVYLDATTPANSDSLYHDAIAALERMQRDCDASSLPRYDQQRLRDEMQLFTDWFCTAHLQLPSSSEASAVFNDAFEFLINEALSQPQVFVHRDYHCRNLMHLESNNPGILDYQDAVLGPIAYDLVSLLRDVYVRWPEAQVSRWIGHYHELAGASGLLAGATLAQFSRWFDLIGVQRHLKIAGIFARLYYRDEKSRYLPDIALCLDYLLDVSGRYPELAQLFARLEEFDIRSLNQQRVRHIIDTQSSQSE